MGLKTGVSMRSVRYLYLRVLSLLGFLRTNKQTAIRSVRDGLWNDPKTWGGVLPMSGGSVQSEVCFGTIDSTGRNIQNTNCE